MLPTRDSLQGRRRRQIESDGIEKIFHKRNEKKAGVVILISDKINLKTKSITKDKEGHYIMIKGSIQEEDITLVKIYAPNIGAPKYTKQILRDIKGEADRNTIIVGDFNKINGQIFQAENQYGNRDTK